MENQQESYLTPCYVISGDSFLKNLCDIRDNFSNHWKHGVICGYSCKTNNSTVMLSLAKQFGMWAEVVSSREYHLAKSVEFSDENIIFNGPNKGDAVYEACRSGALVNIDNLSELETFTEGFIERFHVYPPKLGLRVNFDLESYVPGQTATAEEDGRFGICYENGDLAYAISLLKNKNIHLAGLHIHYTTKTRSLDVYTAIANVMREIIRKHDLHLEYIDIGGGFWGGRKLAGKPTMEQYARTITRHLQIDDAPKLILEPGSALCSTVAEYRCKVVAIKDIRNTRFVVLDGCSLHINPFQADRNAQWHFVAKNAHTSRNRVPKQVLCGSTCLEKDRLAVVENGEQFEQGDIVAFENTGAYTMSLVSDFILNRPYEYLERGADGE